MQVLLSAIILSHHIPEFVLVPGLLLFAIGSLNIILGLIFRDNIHIRRAWAADKPSKNQCQDSQLSNRRTSFRPGGERSRPVAQSSAARSRIPTNLEKPPSYGSKSDGYGYSETPVYYNRSSQQCAKKGGVSIHFPEQAHSKY
ncbi:putative transmembrane protein [Rhizoctonia solani 123E]|uniref:Putative transmembrane protein n=1 Tax=Rhizoctonia solani 123E TaxID=1423351 RepID=A0A074RM37_9AGAM|nr:putative transmembrane protein [Rhizoctonia solani 123E]